VNRVRGVGSKHHIARRSDCRGKAGQPFLRSHGHHHLALGIELDAETAGIVIGLRPAQPRNALGLGITMRIGLARHLAQLVDHMLGRRKIRIAHAQIDNIFTGRSGRCTHRIYLGDDIGRQALHAVKIGIHPGPS